MDIESGQHQLATTTQPAVLFSRAFTQVRQFVCGLHGHDELFHFDRERLSLFCASCGHQSAGWRVSETAPRRTAEPGVMNPKESRL